MTPDRCIIAVNVLRKVCSSPAVRSSPSLLYLHNADIILGVYSFCGIRMTESGKSSKI
jgi:hypothetical protein